MAFVYFECCLCLLFIIPTVCSDDFCPKKCICDAVASKVKLKCGTKEDPIQFLDEINFGNIASNIVELNLHGNNLTNITKLEKLSSLRKLNLSNNYISHIEDAIFIKTPDIKQIDLSNNLLPSLQQTIFEPLTSLKQIDISNNPLVCDCDVLWTSEYLKNKSVKLLSKPKCTYPKSSKIQFLKKMQPSFHNECNLPTNNEETTVKIHPDEDQIVFEGDSLKLNCLASGVSSSIIESKDSEANISWSLNQNYKFSDVGIENNNYGGIIDSSLKILKLNKNHTGNWKCLFTSHNMNQTKTVTVIVITNDTKYCPVTVTTNNKGVYSWPKTIAGYSVDLPCHGNADLRALYKCTKFGNWKNLNTSLCPFTSETTRILEQFSKVNLTLTKVNVYESALHLKKNYTSDIKLLRDTMDVVFISRTVQNYLEFILKEKELGRVLIDIINNMMSLPKIFLKEAEQIDKSCTKFLNSIEYLSDFLKVISRPYFALQEFQFKRETLPSLTCSWYSDVTTRDNPKIHCTTTEESWQINDGEKTLEARVQIPDISFHQQKQDYVQSRLLMGLFSNNKFFPSHFGNGTDSYTSVVGAKLVNSIIDHLSNPITIILRLTDGHDEINPIPVRWESSINKGHGGWTTAGCQVTHVFQDLLVFQCDQLGYYTILQKISTPANLIYSGAKFRLAHPAVYIGGFVLFTSLLTCTVTYLLCYSSIQMAKKAKHSLVNTWIAVALLCFMFTFGIHQTEDLKLCQSVGIIIHYFTLSSLLWMCVTVSNMYKRLNKTETSVLTDDGLQLDQPIQKPILGLYLVGWGVALIVCGISGAVNMKDYASHSFCFLESAPTLSAVFVPVIILIGFMIVFFLLIRCTVRTTDVVTQLSEGTQGTENVDLDLLEPPVSGTASVKSASTRSSMIEDTEHGPLTQLKAHVITLLIFILACVCATISTGQPFQEFFLYEEDLFGILYALLASAFGMFNLFFYCVARHDVRTQWSLARKWFKRKQFCFRTRSISDTNQPIPPLSTGTNQMSVETQITSRSSSRSSSQPKSLSRHSNNLKAAADLNTSTPAEDGKQNVDLVVLHRQQYRTNNTIPVYELSSMNSAEMFYNPHQSGVARKFFKKQRKHMMKHNNLGTRRRDGSVNSVKTNKSNSDVSSNIFGTSSKVNNTNIHVEQIKECKQKNLNILSDNCSDSEISRLDIPVHQLLSAKKVRPTRKPKINTQIQEEEEKDMRTVSQQCSLEYSSETLSERVLDKDLDLDASIACSDFTDFKQEKEEIGKVYVNPIDDLLFCARKSQVSSLKSSVSTSDVDELYAQINPEGNSCPRSRTLATLCADFQDTDVSIEPESLDNIGNIPDTSETAV